MKFILIIISLLPLKILAQDLALECDKNGVLTNITSASNPELCLSTEVLNENGKDLVNVAKKLNSNTISLKTPYRSLVTNKNSNSYDRDSIEETIAWALEAGVDPFAANQAFRHTLRDFETRVLLSL